MSREQTLTQFVAWAQHHITGDEKGQVQIFLGRLFHHQFIKMVSRFRIAL